MYPKVIACLAFLAALFSYSSVLASPEVVDDYRATPIAPDRKEPVFVYFGYGDPASGETVNQVSLKISLDNPALAFATNNIFEIARTNPQSTSCSESTEGKEFVIRSDLVKENVLTYGPGSASHPDAPSGSSIASLLPRQTGCLKIGLRVQPRVQSTARITLQFEQQLTTSNGETRQLTSLPIKKVLFSVGQTPATCPNGQSVFGVECVPSCDTNQYRDLEGKCQPRALNCDTSKELVNDQCVDPCPEGSARNTFGECRSVERTWNEVVSIVVMSVLGLTVFIAFIILVSSILRRSRRSK